MCVVCSFNSIFFISKYIARTKKRLQVFILQDSSYIISINPDFYGFWFYRRQTQTFQRKLFTAFLKLVLLVPLSLSARSSMAFFYGSNRIMQWEQLCEHRIEALDLDLGLHESTWASLIYANWRTHIRIRTHNFYSRVTGFVFSLKMHCHTEQER